MKRKLNAPFWLALLSAILILSLAACVRPVPPPDGADVSQPQEPPAEEMPNDSALPLPPPIDSTPPYPGSEEGDGVEPPVEGSVDVEPPVETTPPDVAPTSHTVQAGETLASVAGQYGLTADELAAANNLTNVNQLDVGQVLTIPAPGTVAQPPTPPTPVAPGLTPGDAVHVVQAGENLFRISLRYGYTVQELAAYNNIPDPARIYVGQVIRFPPR